MDIFKFQQNVNVAEISGKGLGLIAARNFKEGEIVFIVSGKIINSHSRYTVPISSNTSIDTELDNGLCTEAYYINHDCDPSSYVKDGTIIVAAKDVLKGEEINMHYGMLGVFGDEWPRAERVCGCGSDRCSGMVNGINEFTAEEKVRLMPYVQEWVMKKFIRTQT